MSGPTYTSNSITDSDGVTRGTFTFLSRQDRHSLDAARRITGMDIKRNQYKIHEPIPFEKVAQ